MAHSLCFRLILEKQGRIRALFRGVKTNLAVGDADPDSARFGVILSWHKESVKKSKLRLCCFSLGVISGGKCSRAVVRSIRSVNNQLKIFAHENGEIAFSYEIDAMSSYDTSQ